MANDRTSTPTVSVIIPCYNQGRFLPDAVASVRGQTFSDWDCVIVDDGSTDETATVADVLAAGDHRIRVVHQANRGLPGARNEGLRVARGRYIQFLDADDLLDPDKLRRQVSVLSAVEELALSYTDYRYCPENDVTATITRDGFPPPRFITGRPLWDIASRWETEFSIPVHCFLFDTRFFTQRNISFDETLPSHEDWDCWMRIFALDPLVLLVPGPLAVYRLHEEQVTRDRAVLGRGFDMALEKQMDLFGGDPEMQAHLVAKQAQMRRVYNPSGPEVAGRSLGSLLKRLGRVRL